MLLKLVTSLSTLNVTGTVTIDDVYKCEVTDLGLNMTFTSRGYSTYGKLLHFHSDTILTCNFNSLASRNLVTIILFSFFKLVTLIKKLFYEDEC